MTDSPTVFVNLVIIASFVRFIAEEMDVCVIHATKLFLFLDMR